MNVQALGHRVAFYVPSTRDNQPIDPQEWEARTRDVIIQFSRWFGGATYIKATGGWENPDTKAVVTEDVNLVYSFTTIEKIEDSRQKLLAFADSKRQEWLQYSIMIEVGPDGQIVEA